VPNEKVAIFVRFLLFLTSVPARISPAVVPVGQKFRVYTPVFYPTSPVTTSELSIDQPFNLLTSLRLERLYRDRDKKYSLSLENG
jgi:hypothetical protein